jgi:hypothetical protein
MKYYKKLKKNELKINTSRFLLNEKPLINIIIPAWKDEKDLKFSLKFINDLIYPNLKIIINAGGNQETIDVANSYKKYENYTIIYQKEGRGKVSAINDCLDYIEPGLVYFIDSDTIITDKILKKMCFPLLVLNEKAVKAISVPHESILDKNIVKYAYVNRNPKFRRDFSRYNKSFGANGMTFSSIITKIGKFQAKNLFDDNISMGMDFDEAGIKIFQYINFKVPTLNFPVKRKTYINQTIRWMENYLLYNYKSNNKIQVAKFALLLIVSIFYCFIPFLLFFNVNLFFLAISLLSYFYLLKIRKLVFLKYSENVKYQPKVSFSFFFELLFFIYLDFFINLIVFFEFLIFGKKKYKKRKNIA